MAIKTFSDGVSLPASDINTFLTNSGLVYIAGASFSSVTSGAPLDVNSVFSSTYTNYLLVLRVSQTVATGSTVFRMRTAGAADSGAIYSYAWGGTFIGVGPVYNFAGYATTNPFSPATEMFTGIAAGAGYSGTARIDIQSPNVARGTRMLGQAYTDYSGTYYNTALTAGGEVSSVTQYTGFRLYPTAGTASGEYALYGYRIA